jgi:plasmid stabilization system protein ParE
MALEIFWTKGADRKFDKIIEYLSLQWNEQVTSTFIKKVYSFLDVLSEFPEIGTIENQEKGIRGFNIAKQINVFYLVRDGKIILLDFFDNRQNPQKKKF